MKRPLVIIEWEDSAQPLPHWQLLPVKCASAVRCASVGWLLKDGKKVKLLAPNMGGLNGEGRPQVSGVIAIPTRSVVSVRTLTES